MNEISNQMAESHTHTATDLETVEQAFALLKKDVEAEGKFVQTVEDLGDESKPLPN